METRFNYHEMTKLLEGLLLDIYRWYLEIDDLSEMRCDYTLLAEKGDDIDKFDELYELTHPEFFTCDLEFNNAISNNLCIGGIRFGSL